MTDRELLELLLEKVTKIEDGQDELRQEVSTLRQGQDELKGNVKELKANVNDLKQMTKAIFDQTADLTEFRTDTTEKLDIILEDNKSIKEIIGEHEVAIRNLRRRPV